MELQKRKRGINWSSEEKEILRQLIAQSAQILEDKSTKTSVNTLKNKEWTIIMNKFNEITGNHRSVSEMKLAWKRIKLTAKTNLSQHRRAQMKTGGGEKPPSPSPEDLQVLAIAPHDFIFEENDYDSDAVIPVSIAPIDNICAENTDTIVINEENTEHTVMEVQVQQTKISTDPTRNAEIVDSRSTAKRSKKNLLNSNDDMRQSIVQSNTDFKKRQLEMMEVEHAYNIEIAQLKIKKLKLEIALLENNKNTSSEE